MPYPPRPNRVSTTPGVGLRIHDAGQEGASIIGPDTKGRFEGCDFWSNADGGAFVQLGADPIFLACTFRDHLTGKACGIVVDHNARGKTTVGADCIFERNAGGDVKRWKLG